MFNTFLILCFTSFIHVFLRAFQQRNNTQDRYSAVPPVSFLMATTEVTIYSTVAVTAISSGFPELVVAVIGMGSGGSLGCMAAMYTHNRIFPNG